MTKITLKFTNKRAAEIRRTLIERYDGTDKSTLQKLCYIAILKEVYAQSENELKEAMQNLEHENQ